MYMYIAEHLGSLRMPVLAASLPSDVGFNIEYDILRRLRLPRLLRGFGYLLFFARQRNRVVLHE
jgi:hypothetical protein